jgi:molybdopterin/thiamine biosynthesis adenylyltransferase
MNRYDRQISVAEFGVDGQKKLAAATILVVGAGGLASPVLQYLAGAGLGHIKVMDYDIVSVNNMHRQTIFRTDDLGLAKAGAAATNMRGLNPDCLMTPIIEPLTPDNIETYASDVDLVLDCADSFAVSYSLSDYCLNRLPLIHASVVGTVGYVGGFCYNAPSLRAVFPDLPQRFGSCAEDGVLGPIVGIVGSLQAQMTLAVITKQLSSPLGQLVTYDAIGNRFGGFRFDGVEEPDAALAFISPLQLKSGDLVIDLRTADEADLITADAQRFDIDQITPDLPLKGIRRVVLCCRSGQRAWAAAEKLSGFWSGSISLIAAGDPNFI